MDINYIGIAMNNQKWSTFCTLIDMIDKYAVFYWNYQVYCESSY
jgi:hypothetical protein